MSCGDIKSSTKEIAKSLMLWLTKAESQGTILKTCAVMCEDDEDSSIPWEKGY